MKPASVGDTGTVVGSVKTIFRFPVKSVGGRTLQQALVGSEGVLGDRQYAFVDLETGNLANAKHPRKFGSMLAWNRPGGLKELEAGTMMRSCPPRCGTRP